MSVEDSTDEFTKRFFIDYTRSMMQYKRMEKIEKDRTSHSQRIERGDKAGSMILNSFSADTTYAHKRQDKLRLKPTLTLSPSTAIPGLSPSTAIPGLSPSTAIPGLSIFHLFSPNTFPRSSAFCNTLAATNSISTRITPSPPPDHGFHPANTDHGIPTPGTDAPIKFCAFSFSSRCTNAHTTTDTTPAFTCPGLTTATLLALTTITLLTFPTTTLLALTTTTLITLPTTTLLTFPTTTLLALTTTTLLTLTTITLLTFPTTTLLALTTTTLLTLTTITLITLTTTTLITLTTTTLLTLTTTTLITLTTTTLLTLPTTTLITFPTTTLLALTTITLITLTTTFPLCAYSAASASTPSPKKHITLITHTSTWEPSSANPSERSDLTGHQTTLFHSQPIMPTGGQGNYPPPPFLPPPPKQQMQSTQNYLPPPPHPDSPTRYSLTPPSIPQSSLTPPSMPQYSFGSPIPISYAQPPQSPPQTMLPPPPPQPQTPLVRLPTVWTHATPAAEPEALVHITKHCSAVPAAVPVAAFIVVVSIGPATTADADASNDADCSATPLSACSAATHHVGRAEHFASTDYQTCWECELALSFGTRTEPTQHMANHLATSLPLINHRHHSTDRSIRSDDIPFSSKFTTTI
ncbi:hypothetical protein BLNAU_16877 [Blattamonas nauphoetae]|uniref:C2H2-type domain-containing protein n=1 Tax=Blattamonas nauphoetae TaxID=2049346 RepID=A0ABQ9XA67_9EUKA|nr:hypothetical protein BLNAU_16877 [Blattamonas nauphoetae]